MPYFVISYDLRNEITSEAYAPLKTALEDLSAVRTQLSVWYVDLNNTAQEVFDHFSQYIDDNDRLMVVEFSKKPVWVRGIKGTQAWVDSHF